MSRNHRALVLLSAAALLLTSFRLAGHVTNNFKPADFTASGLQRQISGAPTQPAPSPWARRIRQANARPSSIQFGELSGSQDQLLTTELGAVQQAPAQGTLSLPVQAAELTASRLPIIEYHYSAFYFDGVRMRTEWYIKQLEWLAENGYNTLTVDELADFIERSYAPPLRSVALTFDVGISHFDDYSEVVIPTLRRLGLQGIFFVQPGGVREVCEGVFTCWLALREWLAEGLISMHFR